MADWRFACFSTVFVAVVCIHAFDTITIISVRFAVLCRNAHEPFEKWEAAYNKRTQREKNTSNNNDTPNKYNKSDSPNKSLALWFSECQWLCSSLNSFSFIILFSKHEHVTFDLLSFGVDLYQFSPFAQQFFVINLITARYSGLHYYHCDMRMCVCDISFIRLNAFPMKIISEQFFLSFKLKSQ